MAVYELATNGAHAGATPVSDAAPLPITGVAIGDTDDTAADPAGEGTLSAKLRTVTAQLEVFGSVADSAESNPDSEAATVPSLLRGILAQLVALNAILADVYLPETHELKVDAS